MAQIQEVKRITYDDVPSVSVLRKICDEEDYDNLRQVLEEYLDWCMACNFDSVEFCTPNGVVNYEEFVDYTLDKLTMEELEIESKITNEQQANESNSRLEELLLGDDLFALLEYAVEKNEQDTAASLRLQEELMDDTFRQYLNILIIRNDSERLRDQVATRFAYHASEWAHGQLGNITPSKQGIEDYLDDVYCILRERYPNFYKYRSLMQKVAQQDFWIKQIEDDLFRGGGICDDEDNCVTSDF